MSKTKNVKIHIQHQRNEQPSRNDAIEEYDQLILINEFDFHVLSNVLSVFFLSTHYICI